MSDVNLVLLPWVRRGGTAALTEADPLTDAPKGVATARASLVVNNAPPIPMDVRLMGPGHVTGLQPGQVIRTDPTPGSRAFEPNYCPLVEFDEPSLPWLFTPAAANAAQQLRPWLCLAVVRKQPGVHIAPPSRGTLPVLTITSPADPNTELPDLTSSWAWAHAQLTGDLPPRGPGGETGEAAAAMTRLLHERPDRTLSRLVSGRILAPATEYVACVVPTFELGRRAGLGLEIDAEEEGRLRPAWSLGPALTSVELPVFHSWEFATGPNGDFQSLALLIRARQLPAGVGERPVDISASGVDVAVPAGTTLPLGGALVAVTASDAPTRPEWNDETLHDAYRVALAAIVNAPDELPPDEPVLAPPRYGATQSGLQRVDPAQRARWYEQLNLEPAARATARFGTQLVQEQQEALVASAWEQAAELKRVNTVLRQAQFGVALGTSLHRRHLETMTPDAGLQVLSPARAQLSLSAAAKQPGTGLVALWRAAQIPPAAFGTAMRRIVRPQGAVNRRVIRATRALIADPATRPTASDPAASDAATAAPIPDRPRTALRSLQPTARRARLEASLVVLGHLQDGSTIVGPPIDGLVTLERVAIGLPTNLTWAATSADAVAGAPQNPDFEFQPVAPGGRRPPVFDPGPVIPVEPLPTVPTVPTRPRPTRPLPTRPGGLPRPSVPGRPRPIEPLARLRPVDPDNPFPDPFPEPEPEPEPFPRPRPRDTPAAKAFRALAAAHLRRFDPRPPVPPRDVRPVIDLSAVFAAALARIAPLETYSARVGVLIDRRATVAPAPVPTPELLDAITFTPRFPQPLAPALAAIDQDLMLPGLEQVPPNTAVPLQTNSPFVDAVMVGFNSELGHELVWREFPTPLRATYADRFWDAGATDRPPDIPPLGEWGDRPLGGSQASDERFVVLLRSELLRRYPDAVVYATKPDTPTAMPILSGSMEPDVRFFGFDIPADDIGEWSIVIAEQPSAPRFGVEVDEVPAGTSHLPVTATDGTAASLAARLRQHPVRFTIPASVLLRPTPTIEET